MGPKIIAGAIALAAGTTCHAGTQDAQPILLVCNELRSHLCQSLSRIIEDRATPRTVSIIAETDPIPENAPVVIHFVQKSRTDDMLSGHLAWSGNEISPGAGPELELSVMDAPLNDEMIADFAAQLVQTTDLPF